MKHLLLICIFLGVLFQGNATHIVGGEFQLKHLNSNNYQLTLNMYFDNVNGNPGAVDRSIWVHIFEKNTNRRIDSVYFSSIARRVPVAYTSIACTSASLSTDKIVYSRQITLDENKYTSPGGYYVVWEKCCRNAVINNIINPVNAGQSFYLEFPPLKQNGTRFINSSPELFPPLSDYACIGEQFYYNFGGTDPDGDSLAYEMVTPLNGSSRPNSPTLRPAPAPYELIRWSNGFSNEYQIPGDPTISIGSKSGLLTIRPTQLGLFVFGVRCSEYRNKKKIGEVRRDFQLLVLSCPKNGRPTALLKEDRKSTFYQEGIVLRIPANSTRFLHLFLTDPDANEQLFIEAKPVNFTSTQPFLNINQGTININGKKDSLKVQVKFPNCLDSKDKVYLIDFIVRDDGCSLPKMDTIRLSFQIEPVPNIPPDISTTAAATVLRPRIDDVIVFDVTGTDQDNELVSLSLTGQNFDITKQKMFFKPLSANGTVTSQFSWKIDCSAVTQQSFLLNFTVTSNSCGKLETKNTVVEVRPNYLNQGPVVTSNLAGKTIDVLFGTTLTDTVFATDVNQDKILITAAGEGFDMRAYGMKYNPSTGFGKARSGFSWTPDCSIAGRNQFKVNFTVTETACEPAAPQIVSVILNVKQPETPAFIPANIFTPNNDGKNDYFVMPTLPPDFCGNTFTQIKIYNRWGSMVYQTIDRNFKWDGKNMPGGVYFYYITYSDKAYKGSVTLVQ